MRFWRPATKAEASPELCDANPAAIRVTAARQASM